MNSLSPVLRKNAPSLIQLLMALVIMIGAAALYGWMTHNILLIQIRPQYSGMKFNSAIGLILTAASLIAAERGKWRFTTLLTLLGAALPLMTLAEYILGVDFGIDTLFAAPLAETGVRFPGRMAPNTTAALLLADFGILLYALVNPLPRSGKFALALAGSVIVALGVVPLVGYMGGIESAHTWGDFAGMALHTAICFILIGVSLVVCTWQRSSSMPSWLPLPVAIGFLTIALSIWLAVHSYEDIRFEQSLQTEADYIAGRGYDRMVAFYAAIDRIDNRWEAAGGTARSLWESDASSYLKGYPFLKNLEWVDGNNYLQWIVPVEGSEKLSGVPLNTEGTRATAAQQARDTHTPQVTDAVDLAQGGKGFLYMSPLYVGDRYDGLIVAAFTLDDIFNRILTRDKNGPFYLTVSENDAVLFTNQPADYRGSDRWRKNATMKNRDKSLLITVNPTPELLARKNSPLPNLVLLTGLMTALFGTFSVLLAIRSRRDADAVRKSEIRLRHIIGTNSVMAAANFDLDALMNSIVQRAHDVIPATGIVIELVEEDEMVYRAASGSVTPYVGLRLKRNGSLSGLCVEQQTILISRDTTQDTRVNADACLKVGAASMVVVPLVQRGKAVGVLKAVSIHIDAFTEHDIQTLQLMAVLLGGALGQQLEIERRKKLESQLIFLAQNDSLTGLPNRMLFQDRLTHAIHNHTRSQTYMAVMYMDIDHFKLINDSNGHGEGDALLRQFATRVLSVLRGGDTLARMGGDEFTLIAENLRTVEDADLIAEKILEAMRQPFHLQNVKLTIGVSIGIAIADKNKKVTSSLILESADQALYEAKKAGRNCFRKNFI